MSHSAPGVDPAFSANVIETRLVYGDTVWVGVRARGADWSWLTPDEAVELGRVWIEKYSRVPQAAE
jgi:hypothetical protein